MDFTASWCGPCRIIAPTFDQLSLDFPQLIFLKVDVDANEVRVSFFGTCSLFADGILITGMLAMK